MKKINLFIITLIVSFALVSFTSDRSERQATSWEIDPAHSAVNFEVIHFFTPVNGTFDKFSGDINFDPDNPGASSANFKVDVSSINTRNDKRDGHLMSPDFFHAEKWPYMTFESTKITKKGDNEFTVTGNLTIRDVTKEISFPLTVLGVRDHPMKEGKKLMGVKLETEIDRTDYNVGVDDWAATTVVGDDVEISINMELLADK